ncbi:transposase, partial [Escherichia coli]|uniref:transposase n=1 Tax=Escherichia coli TaxID=562 RepID=UPI0038F7C096
ADSEFSSKRRQTRKEIFLSRMEQILPWQNMVEVIEPFYPKAGNGRRPYPLETMLRIHCMQHWYNLSDGAMEDALYEIASMRLFARLSLDSALPDRTTIMNFRHLLEQHQLARQLFTYPLETMLRIHCMQHWYNLSDGAMEDALYEIASMRLFARLSLDSALPDRTTIMNFRHLLEQHQLARQLFKTIN